MFTPPNFTAALLMTIASAICWLLSESARGVTGEALNVSAGQTMV